MKKRRILVIMSTIVLLCCIGLTIFAALTEAIIEKHTITLDSDLLKVSKTNSNYEDYVSYSSGDTIYVDNYEDGYDLIAVTGDNSDGFVITTNQKTASYTPDLSKFDSEKSYFIVAVLYHSFNRYVDNFYDLELLNNEYRHNVVNDDLNIGNITDFYNAGGDYIGSLTSYNISNGLYDYNKQPIKSITDGENTYVLNDGIYSSVPIDLTKYHRNDFYDDNGNLVTGSITPTNTLISDNIYFSGYFDAYGRRLDHIYYVDENQKRWNLVFTEAGIVTNGIKNNANQPQTINLSTAYYDNGIVVDDAFNSKTFKNIYILKDFETKNELSLIMPCNIHLLNNHITLNDNITLKHYYHSNYTIDTLSIESSAGGLIGDKKIEIVYPNAEINYDSSLESKIINNSNNNDLLSDVIEFVEGYFVDYILKDKYYQVYHQTNDGKKLVNYESVNLIDGLYTSEDAGETLVPVTSIKADDDITYTLAYTDNYVTSITDGTDTYLITYDLGHNITEIKKNGEAIESRNLYIDISSKTEYYTLFLTNPVLPKNFYDEDVVIKYTYTDTDKDFYVEAKTTNQKVGITITASSEEDSKTKDVSSWIMGTSDASVIETVALKLECDINRGFSRNSTSRMYINYDTIKEIIGNYNITFEAINNIIVNDDVYLEVSTPIAGNSSINVYTKSGDVYTKVSDSSSYDSETTYYERYLLIERVSYSVSDGFAELKLSLNGSEKVIYAQLPRISLTEYEQLIKAEIGTIFFGGDDNNTYQLPNVERLAKFDVRSVTYTPKIYVNNEYQDAGDVFTIDSDYLMTNVSASKSTDYYLEVRLTLNDGKIITIHTDKIIFTTSTTGGDGENDYQSSLFEQDFNEIYNFIGLSNDFRLDGNVYFYLDIIKANDTNITNNKVMDSENEYLGLYKKVTNYDVNSIPTNNTYFYLNEGLEKMYIGTNEIPSEKPALYTTASKTDAVVGNNYRMVFITNSNNIPTTSTTIYVKAYITDNANLSTAQDLIDKTESASQIDLYNGIYDANKNPIYEITNGKIKYVITYGNGDATNPYSVTSVKKIDENGVETILVNGTKVDLSGYYCFGYVYHDVSTGDRINIKNGLFNNKTVYGHAVSSYEYDNKLKFTFDYTDLSDVKVAVNVNLSDNNTFTDKEGNLITSPNYNLSNGIYDNDGNALTKFNYSDSSFTLSYDTENNCTGVVVDYTIANDTIAGYYYRTSSQQTTFYNYDGTVITIYVQEYQFIVPGIYNPNDFNWNGDEFINETGSVLEEDSANASITYDLYSKLMQLYGFDNGDGNYGYKEINGKKYFLLVDYLNDAINFGDINITYKHPTEYSTTSIYYELVDDKYVEKIDVTSENYESYYIVDTTTYDPIDCANKYIKPETLEKCPNLEGIYIKNAKFFEDDNKEYNFSDSSLDGNITTNTVIQEGLTVHAKNPKSDVPNSNYVTFGDANETINGVTYTKRMTFNGGADFDADSRYLELDITGNEKTLIQVVLKSQNQTQNRFIYVNDTKVKNSGLTILTSCKASGTANIESFLYTGNSNTLYLYPGDGRPSAIYAIYVYNVSESKDNLRNSGLKNTIKNLYLENISGISGVSYDFSNYKNIERLTIKNSNLVSMPTLYRRIVDLNLDDNKLQDISNISTGVNLENISLKNNIIKTFEPLRQFKTIKSLYIGGNISNSIAVVDGTLNDQAVEGGTDLYLYGTPRTENNQVRGLINLSNLIQVCDNNKTLNNSNTDFYDYIYETAKSILNDTGNIQDYLYCIYTLNALSYSNKHYAGLEIDLTLFQNAGYTTNVYVSSDTANYFKLTPAPSNNYSGNGLYSTNDTSYKYALVEISKGGYTLYREIYIKTN